jgi:hypothetical protein
VAGATSIGLLALAIGGSPLGLVAGAIIGSIANQGAAIAEDRAVDHSDALQLLRRICDEWLLDFANLVPCSVANVVHMLQRLQEHPVPSSGGEEPGAGTLLDTLRRYMYATRQCETR